MKTRCELMRASSVRMSRMYCARSGTSMSMRRSAATMKGISFA